MTNASSTNTWFEHYDHYADGVMADPFPIWEELREHAPVTYSDQNGGFWVSSAHEHISHVLKNHGTFSSRRALIPGDMMDTVNADGTVVVNTLPPITLDPPEHTRIRRLLQPAFAPKQIQALEVFTQEISDELMKELAKRDSFDAASEYARYVPVAVISRMLGVPATERELFLSWVKRMASLDPESNDAQEASLELRRYLAGSIRERREHPADDVLSLIVHTAVDGEALTDAEVLGCATLLLFAGVDTTFSAIGASLHYLADHPDDRARLIAATASGDDELWRTAVEEFVRAFAPAMVVREATQDTELGGHRVSAGDLMLLLLPSANRDGGVFEDPATVRIDRHDNPHLTFGSGVHRCLGQFLARMEVRVALQTFLTYVPDFSVADASSVTYSGPYLRGVQSLPLRVHGRANSLPTSPQQR